MGTSEKFIPLAQAAQRLGKSWSQMYHLVLTRAVEARQEPNARWFVLESDVDALLAEEGMRLVPHVPRSA